MASKTGWPCPSWLSTSGWPSPASWVRQMNGFCCGSLAGGFAAVPIGLQAARLIAAAAQAGKALHGCMTLPPDAVFFGDRWPDHGAGCLRSVYLEKLAHRQSLSAAP